jgi:hypothetical protein
MTKNRITGAIAALSLLAVPAVAAAHGTGDDHGHHAGRDHHRHHAKKAKIREVTGSATGTVASFTAGALTITLPSGRSFTADVTKRTILECRSAPTTATAARHGDDDGNGDDSGPGKGGNGDGANHDANDDHGDDNATTTAPASTSTPPSTTVPAPTTGDDGPNHDAGDDHGDDDHGVRCDTAALVPGAKVAEAKLSLQGGDSVWKKIELLK